MTRPDPVEVIARARWERSPQGRWMKKPWHALPPEGQRPWLEGAASDLSALKDAGYAVVPVEPTEAMQNAILEAVKDGIAVDDDAHRSIRHGYRTMLRASQPEQENENGR